jgi:hypothetical protein
MAKQSLECVCVLGRASTTIKHEKGDLAWRNLHLMGAWLSKVLAENRGV